MSEPLCRPTFHLLPPQGWLRAIRPEETPVLSVPNPKSAELYKMSEIIDGHPIIAYN